MSSREHLEHPDLEPDSPPGRSNAGGRGPGESVAPLLHLQRTAGNAAVTALVRSRHVPAVQRLAGDETADEGGAGSDLDAGQVDADELEVEIESELDPESVADTLGMLLPPDEELGDYELPDESITAQALFIQRQATPPGGGGPSSEPGEPAPPREGSAGDVLKAILPYLEPAIEALKADVLRTLRRLKAGEIVATAVVTAPIVIGPLTQPGPRRLALDQLNGTDITFGLVPNLKIQPQISDGALRGGTVTYDLAPAMRRLGIPW